MSKKGKASRYSAARAPKSNEAPEARVERLYGAEGGPLVAWLIDEARIRGMALNEMAAELDVTYGYISQLRNGIRSTAHIGHEFAQACSAFLGVPPIVVKILAGRISMSDFASPRETEEVYIERGFRRMLSDPEMRRYVPTPVDGLSLDAKRAIVLMYMEHSGQDVLNIRELPWMLQYLQRAVVVHDENEGLVVGREPDFASEECINH